MPTFVLTAHVLLHFKCSLRRFLSLTRSYSKIHPCSHSTQYWSATGMCVGNQALRYECGPQEGSSEQRSDLVVALPVPGSAVLCRLWKQAQGNGWECWGRLDLGRSPGAFQDWSRNCSVCGFGLLCIHTTVHGLVLIVWSMETGWEEGHRRDNSSARKPPIWPFGLPGSLVLCFVPQKGGWLRKWGWRWGINAAPCREVL